MLEAGLTSDPLVGKVAVITGASDGVGQAVAAILAQRGATLCLAGRHQGALEEMAAAARGARSVHLFDADFGNEHTVRNLAHQIELRVGKVDILVHCAGAHSKGPLRDAPIEQLDLLYRINVRAPYLLTQLMLPLLIATRGQIVFVNSTQGLEAGATVGQYAATKHALKVIADSLRQELNADGVRVLTVENPEYVPELSLQPSDIAAVIVNALTVPRTAEVTNISIRPFVASA